MPSDSTVIARIASAVGDLPQDQWDALAGTDNPFTSHAFLTALEDSGSAGRSARSLPRQQLP